MEVHTKTGARRVTEQDKEIIESWYKKAQKVGSDGSVSLDALATEVVEGYDHDYGTCVHAASAIAMAAINKVCCELGMSAFQHGCVLHELIRREFGLGKILGHRIQDFDNILFPQYLHDFTDPMEVEQRYADRIASEAKKKLAEEDGPIAESVKNHWEKLASGWLPPFIRVKRPADIGAGQKSA